MDLMSDEKQEKIEKLEQRIESLEARLSEKDESEERNESSELSRREFLKKVGAGAVGVGALSLVPSASALNIRSDRLSFYGSASPGKDFDIDGSGNMYADGTTIWDSSAGQIPESAIESVFASSTDDGSDISPHKLNGGPVSNTQVDLVDVTASATLTGGFVFTTNPPNTTISVEVDGGPAFNIDVVPYPGGDGMAVLPPINADSSLKVTLDFGSNTSAAAQAFTVD